MALINPTLPTIGQPNSTEDQDVINALTTIISAINGGLDAANIADGSLTTADLAAAAGIVGTQLAAATVTTDKIATLPQAKVKRDTAVSIPNATWTAVAFPTEVYDLGTPSTNMHDNVTNNSRLTCRVAGLYLVTGKVALPAATPGTARGAAIRKNGVDVSYSYVPPSSAGGQVMVEVNCPVRLAVNDYVELFAYQDTGAAQNADGGSEDRTFLAATWISL